MRNSKSKKNLKSSKNDSVRKRLRNLNKIKSEFITLASHQLMTPLSAIRWYSEILLSGDLGGGFSKREKNFLQEIHSNCYRMTDLIENMLRVSDIEGGKIKINPKRRKLEVIIREALRRLGAEISRKKIKVLFDVENHINTWVLVDSNKIERVALNILENAVTYNVVGGKIEIGLYKDKDFIHCAISDTGIGIPKDKLDQVFTMFFRSRKAVSENTYGNGLDLYVVKAYVESHGGRIWVESEEGKGSTFIFALPKG
jgi:signal transduction histidine kinase